MPRLAAIDVGSNALRLRVIEASAPGQVREIASERAAVRLGREVFLEGRLAAETMFEAVEALRRFRDVMRAAGVESYRAVATSAVREAQNAVVLVERAWREANISLEVIEGVEEARLVLVAVGRAVKLRGRRALLIDIGGGSVELTALSGGGGGLRESVSLPMGAVRLHEAFVGGDGVVTEERRKLIGEYIERLLRDAKSVMNERPGVVVATGGNAEAVAALAGVETEDGPGIDLGAMVKLRDEMASVPARVRKEKWNLRGDRTDVIVPAMFVLSEVTERAGVGRVVTPGVGLKDGILVELVDRAFKVWDERSEAREVESAAVALGRKYCFDEAHAMHVAALAVSLFDQLVELHRLGDEERLLLRLAAIVHDVGDFVGFDAHHKHTYYIVTHSEIMGLTPGQKELVANVARYHRKALPELSHPGFKKLDRKSRVVVQKLAAMLRVADAFDREHRRKVLEIKVKTSPKKLALYAVHDPNVSPDAELALERWTALRKADGLAEVFGVEVCVDGADALGGGGASR